MDLEKDARAKKFKIYPNMECRYFQSSTSHVVVNTVNPYNTVGTYRGRLQKDYSKKSNNVENDDNFDKSVKTPYTGTSNGLVHEIMQDYEVNTDIFINENNSDLETVFTTNQESDLSQRSLNLSSRPFGTDYAASCSRSVPRTSFRKRITRKYNYNNKRRHLSTNETYTMSAPNEIHSAEKTTYCRSINNMYNEQFFFKTMQKNARLQNIVKKLVIERQREKQREHWNNYINELKNKHGYHNETTRIPQYASDDRNVSNSIDDYYNMNPNWLRSEPTQTLIDDFYRACSNVQPSKYPRQYGCVPYQNRSPYYESKSFCYPTCPEGTLRMMNNGEVPAHLKKYFSRIPGPMRAYPKYEQEEIVSSDLNKTNDAYTQDTNIFNTAKHYRIQSKSTSTQTDLCCQRENPEHINQLRINREDTSTNTKLRSFCKWPSMKEFPKRKEMCIEYVRKRRLNGKRGLKQSNSKLLKKYGKSGLKSREFDLDSLQDIGNEEGEDLAQATYRREPLQSGDQSAGMLQEMNCSCDQSLNRDLSKALLLNVNCSCKRLRNRYSNKAMLRYDGTCICKRLQNQQLIEALLRQVRCSCERLQSRPRQKPKQQIDLCDCKSWQNGDNHEARPMKVKCSCKRLLNLDSYKIHCTCKCSQKLDDSEVECACKKPEKIDDSTVECACEHVSNSIKKLDDVEIECICARGKNINDTKVECTCENSKKVGEIEVECACKNVSKHIKAIDDIKVECVCESEQGKNDVDVQCGCKDHGKAGETDIKCACECVTKGMDNIEVDCACDSDSEEGFSYRLGKSISRTFSRTFRCPLSRTLSRSFSKHVMKKIDSNEVECDCKDVNKLGDIKVECVCESKQNIKDNKVECACKDPKKVEDIEVKCACTESKKLGDTEVKCVCKVPKKIGDSEVVCTCKEPKKLGDTEVVCACKERQKLGDTEVECTCKEPKKIGEAEIVCTCKEPKKLGDTEVVCACKERQKLGDTEVECACIEPKKLGDTEVVCACKEPKKLGDTEVVCACKERQKLGDTEVECACIEPKKLGDTEVVCACKEPKKLGNTEVVCACKERQKLGDTEVECVCKEPKKLEDTEVVCACKEIKKQGDTEVECVCKDPNNVSEMEVECACKDPKKLGETEVVCACKEPKKLGDTEVQCACTDPKKVSEIIVKCACKDPRKLGEFKVECICKDPKNEGETDIKCTCKDPQKVGDEVECTCEDSKKLDDIKVECICDDVSKLIKKKDDTEVKCSCDSDSEEELSYRLGKSISRTFSRTFSIPLSRSFSKLVTKINDSDEIECDCEDTQEVGASKVECVCESEQNLNNKVKCTCKDTETAGDFEVKCACKNPMKLGDIKFECACERVSKRMKKSDDTEVKCICEQDSEEELADRLIGKSISRTFSGSFSKLMTKIYDSEFDCACDSEQETEVECAYRRICRSISKLIQKIYDTDLECICESEQDIDDNKVECGCKFSHRKYYTDVINACKRLQEVLYDVKCTCKHIWNIDDDEVECTCKPSHKKDYTDIICACKRLQVILYDVKYSCKRMWNIDSDGLECTCKFSHKKYHTDVKCACRRLQNTLYDLKYPCKRKRDIEIDEVDCGCKQPLKCYPDSDCKLKRQLDNDKIQCTCKSVYKRDYTNIKCGCKRLQKKHGGLKQTSKRMWNVHIDEVDCDCKLPPKINPECDCKLMWQLSNDAVEGQSMWNIDNVDIGCTCKRKWNIDNVELECECKVPRLLDVTEVECSYKSLENIGNDDIECICKRMWNIDNADQECDCKRLSYTNRKPSDCETLLKLPIPNDYDRKRPQIIDDVDVECSCKCFRKIGKDEVECMCKGTWNIDYVDEECDCNRVQQLNNEKYRYKQVSFINRDECNSETMLKLDSNLGRSKPNDCVKYLQDINRNITRLEKLGCYCEKLRDIRNREESLEEIVCVHEPSKVVICTTKKNLEIVKSNLANRRVGQCFCKRLQNRQIKQIPIQICNKSNVQRFVPNRQTDIQKSMQDCLHGDLQKTMQSNQRDVRQPIDNNYSGAQSSIQNRKKDEQRRMPLENTTKQRSWQNMKSEGQSSPQKIKTSYSRMSQPIKSDKSTLKSIECICNPQPDIERTVVMALERTTVKPLQTIEEKLDKLIASFNSFVTEIKSSACYKSKVKIPSSPSTPTSPSATSTDSNKQPKSAATDTQNSVSRLQKIDQVLYTTLQHNNPRKDAISDDNIIRLKRNTSNTKLENILKEEIEKSNKIRRDIKELLHTGCEGHCSVDISYDIPTKEVSISAPSSLLKTPMNSDDIQEVITPIRSGNRMTIAVNTDPLGFLALLRISAEMVKQLLSSMPLTYQYSLPRSLQPSASHRPAIAHYVCSICGASFRRPSQLSDHIQQNHDLGRTRDCCVCRHVLDMQHDKIGLYKCKYCGKMFARAYCCELHQQTCAKLLGRQHDVSPNLMFLR